MHFGKVLEVVQRDRALVRACVATCVAKSVRDVPFFASPVSRADCLASDPVQRAKGETTARARI